jgi:hypothetical protein
VQMGIYGPWFHMVRHSWRSGYDLDLVNGQGLRMREDGPPNRGFVVQMHKDLRRAL